jgi:CheY-like chemotaxis protein
MMSQPQTVVSAPVLLLYVEDEPLIALANCDALEAAGYTLERVENGAHAINRINEIADDLSGLITDIRLGSRPSGWDVAQHARSKNGALPVIYTTADSAGDWPIYGVPLSILIQKPSAAGQLVTAISALLNHTA